MNYNYIPGSKFLDIAFNFSRKKVIEKLGLPQRKETYKYKSTQDFDETYYYDHYNIRIVFSFSKNRYKRLSIYTKILHIDNENIFSLKKPLIINAFSNISVMKQKPKIERQIIQQTMYESIEFKDIGVTLWFTDDLLDEVCLFKPKVTCRIV